MPTPSDRTPFVLRPATPDDAAGCAFVHHTSWVETYWELIPASHWEIDTLERRTAVWRQHVDAGAEVTVAESDGHIIGIAISGGAQVVGEYEPARDRQLSMLYVLAAHHGTGVGQALLDAVLPPDTPAQLWVAEQNPRARRFYERNGFLPDGTRFVEEGPGLAEVRLVR